MNFLLKFFGGMSITGYVITGLLTVLVGMSITVAWLNKSKDKLEKQLAQSEYAIEQIVAANENNQIQLENAYAELRRCTAMREAAERNALEIEQRLYHARIKAEAKTDERVEQIADATPPDSVCGDSALPSRVTGLLVEAARSANRDADG